MANEGEPQEVNIPSQASRIPPCSTETGSASELISELLDTPPDDDAIPLAHPVAFPLPPKPAPEIYLMGESRSAAWGDILLFLLLFVAFDAIGGILIVGVYRSLSGTPPAAMTDPRTEKALLVPMLAWRSTVAVLIVGVIARYRRGSARSVGLTSRNLPIDLLIAFGAAMAAGLIIAIVMSTLAFCFPAFAAQLEENGQRIMDRVPRVDPAAFAFVTLLVGLWEELVFRGFLLPRLRRATGSWTVAVVLSTAVFAALHLIDQVAAALVLVVVLSLMFSLITIWRRSIVPAVIAHALFDFGMFLQLFYLAGDQWK